ncbi:MAG: GNAT family N-acetyltransferase [Deltaproteobacteria bacterium]|nr:GNAT family N-acetyltransferase [Deltaproteobacteria bacterium]
MSSSFTVRLMKADDFDAVVALDSRTTGAARVEYYQMKFDKLFASKEFLPTSMVAEDEAGALVGFVMAELYMGEYGISRAGATLDTIGVEPGQRQQGVGKELLEALMAHLKQLGVTRVNTLVDVSDETLLTFFSSNAFERARSVVYLERAL